MISVKDTKKRTITIKGVQLKDGMLVDIETGENVLSQIANKLPENANMFDMKVDVQIPDDVEFDEEFDEYLGDELYKD